MSIVDAQAWGDSSIVSSKIFMTAFTTLGGNELPLASGSESSMEIVRRYANQASTMSCVLIDLVVVLWNETIPSHKCRDLACLHKHSVDECSCNCNAF